MGLPSSLLNRHASRLAALFLLCSAVAVASANQQGVGAAAQDPKKLHLAAPTGKPGAVTEVGSPPSMTRDQVRRSVPKPDGVSEMGQENQLRMQQQMDRKAKSDEAISNIMKKQSSINSGIVGNLK